MGRALHHSLALMMILVLGACAAPARPERMVPDRASLPTFVADSPLRGAIAITEVSGGEETSAMGHSNVGDKELKAALHTALEQEGLLSKDETSAPLRLKAVLIDLSHPPGVAAFTMTIHSTILYQLTRAQTQESLFNEVITTSFSATVGDEFVGVERLRIANEGSVRANIAEFLSRLTKINAAVPVPSQGNAN